MKAQVNQMQQKMREEQQRQQFAKDGYVNAGPKTTAEKPVDKDYIDFEEIKDR